MFRSALMGDDDLKAFLPDPPPPAPKRKEAAISEALARFDGTPAPERRPRPESAPWWKKLQRPQAGLLAMAALVATISLPFAWMAPDRGPPAAEEQVSENFRDTSLPGRLDVEVPTAAAPLAEAAPRNEVPTSAQETASRADDLAPVPRLVVQPMVAPVAKPAPAPSGRAEESEQIVVRAQKMSRPVADSPTAVSVVSADRVAEDSNIVVTGARVGSAKSERRGDWNACTLNDPGRALSKCRKLANRGSKAVRSEADAHLSSGLEQAWRGNLAGAIAAFDQAIAVAPDLSVAYLNRGLAYERQGDSARALADLDKAVQYAPRSARALYNRSVVLRGQGDKRRAARDEDRAISLDPDYQAIIR
ncbi:MAG: tetratricopeptide repeat protein [Sphingopyxis sp.]|nr:tetratricopeptide repeat protein [Sphingopyxis sp.]